MSSAKLFLIDAHALCYRSFYAIKDLSTSKGQATNAVYGFMMTLRKILRDYQPEYLAVCFDSPQKTHRQEKFAEYKIQRPSMPDDLISQIPIIKQIIKAYKMAIFECGGYEADDIIATLSQKVLKKDIDVIIVSDDKDMYQLVNERIKFFSPRHDALWGHDDLKERLGFEPHYIADYIGLAGDQTDNIPGVKGIGEVSARSLINEYGALDTILENVENIDKPKVKKMLTTQKEAAVLAKELALLKTNVPVKFKLEDLQVQAPDRQRLYEMFKELEFKTLAREHMPEDQKNKNTFKIRSFKTKEDLGSLVQSIQKSGQFAFYIGSVEQEELFAPQEMFISLGDSEVFQVPGDKLNLLKTVFEDEKIVKITHNLKETLKVLSSLNISLKGESFDIMLAGYLLASGHSSAGLNELAWAYLKESIPEEQASAYAAHIIYQLYAVMAGELKKKSLEKLFEDIEMPLAHVLSKMEAHGVNIDVNLLKKLSKECEGKINALTKKLYDLAGEEFNLNSPKQLSGILFEKLKLPVIKKTKTGFSTDESVLTKLAEEHAVPSFILEYRQLAKLKSTYIDALPQLVDKETKRIHAQFVQTGTETGRLSSKNPNLQNIPIRTELGRQIRKAIIPSRKDLLMVAADYSQIELRILAHLSKDKNLMKAFKEEQDIHRYTASLMFDVKEEKVTPQMRDSAKRVNFGIIYGMSAFGLAKDLKIPQGEAQDFIDKYFLRYPNVKKFMDNAIKTCEENGYVLTLLNRRRYIPEIKSNNMTVRQFAQRQAINTPVQGSAADLMKLAMINIQKEFEKQKWESKMLITVHDELVFDVTEKEKDDVVDSVRDLMEHPIALSVPIKVTIKAGSNWLEMKEIK